MWLTSTTRISAPFRRTLTRWGRGRRWRLLWRKERVYIHFESLKVCSSNRARCRVDSLGCYKEREMRTRGCSAPEIVFKTLSRRIQGSLSICRAVLIRVLRRLQGSMSPRVRGLMPRLSVCKVGVRKNKCVGQAVKLGGHDACPGRNQFLLYCSTRSGW